MVSIWGQVKGDDSALIRGALSYADRVWSAGTRLGDAVHWVERAADFAARDGDATRARELTSFADELRGEVARRSGMPEKTDPAWAEARRLQTSLIDVRDSWLDPLEREDQAKALRGVVIESDRHSDEAIIIDFELSEPTNRSVTLTDDEIEELDEDEPDSGPSESRGAPATVIDLESTKHSRATESKGSWFEEAPTLRQERRVTRDKTRPLLGSINELALLTALEAVGEPGDQCPESQAPPLLSAFPEAADLGRVYLATLQSARGFEDLSEEKAAQLAHAGSLMHLGPGEEVRTISCAVVLDGSLSVHELAQARESSHLMTGETLSLLGSVFAAARPRVVGASLATTLLVWDQNTLHRVLDVCPWVFDSLRLRADELLTYAAIPLSRVARNMGESFRQVLLSSSRVLTLPPGGVLMEASTEVHSLNITGVGSLELVDHGRTVETLMAGTVLFPEELRKGSAAPLQARAGQNGATVLRTEATEFMRFLPHIPLLARVLRHTR